MRRGESTVTPKGKFGKKTNKQDLTEVYRYPISVSHLHN